ncbi:MAG TPA: GspH/FimT family pseudopilin [Sedimentisphaerales bacterium]|nr:GspH/FimT family pseudopilin [Sedimentisphaerales bacterium]
MSNLTFRPGSSQFEGCRTRVPQAGTCGFAAAALTSFFAGLRKSSQQDRRTSLYKVRHQGFTLLELILVMVILSTVLAMAAPSLRGFFASRQMQDAAAQLLTLTQLARSQAVCEGTGYRLNLDVEQGQYWLTSWQSGAFEKIKTEFGQVFTLPKDTVMELYGVERQGSEIFVSFAPQGTSSAARIRLVDRRGKIVDVMCRAATESFCIVIGEQNNGGHI